MARRRTGRMTERKERNPAALPVTRRVEVGADGADYEVKPVPTARAIKVYRCPGCDHEIRLGTAHVVVWPAGSGTLRDSGKVEDRRHWHTSCWRHRASRGPTRKWS